VIERLVDLAAKDLGLDRVEIRRRNLIAPDQFPYRTPTGNIYDSGNYQGVLEKVLAAVDYDHWVAERDRARAEGRHVGIGVVASNERSVFSSTEFWFWFDKPEFTPTSSPESASLQIDPTGSIVVTLHSQSLWGNSPETVVSQVVAEEFDVDPESITVTYADSQHALPGTGPGGSRYTVMVSGAVAGAASELKDKIKRLVAHKLEVAEDDLEFRGGAVACEAFPTGSSRSPRSRSARTCSGWIYRPTWRAASPRSRPMTIRSRRCRTPTAPTSASSTRSSATPGTSRSWRSTRRRAS